LGWRGSLPGAQKGGNGAGGGGDAERGAIRTTRWI
jgi:hypothetical protein